MPAINFSVFKDKLVRGEKLHTIRKSLPRGWETGKPLSLYTGMRTKGCHKLVDTFCNIYEELFIDFAQKSIKRQLKHPLIGSVCCYIKGEKIEILAKNDGFSSVDDFWAYFKDYNESCYLCYLIWKDSRPLNGR